MIESNESVTGIQKLLSKDPETSTLDVDGQELRVLYFSSKSATQYVR